MKRYVIERDLPGVGRMNRAGEPMTAETNPRAARAIDKRRSVGRLIPVS